MTDKRIFRINTGVSGINPGQCTIEPSADADIGVKTFAWMDYDSNEYKALVLNQDAVVKAFETAPVLASGEVLKMLDSTANKGFQLFRIVTTDWATIDADEIAFNDQHLSAAIRVSESGTTGLVGFTAISIIGALNEALTSGGSDAESFWNLDIEEPDATRDKKGLQLFANPSFSADADWTKGTGWTIAAGVATKAAGSAADLTQASIGIEVGVTYEHIFEITAISASTFTPLVGSTSGTARSTIGWYREEIVAAGSDIAGLQATATTAGSVDNQTIRKIRSAVPVSSGRYALKRLENHFTYPEDFSDADWSKTRMTIASTGKLSPVIDRDTGLNVPYLGLVGSSDVDTNKQLTQSPTLTASRAVFRVFACAGDVTWVWLRNFTANKAVYIDLVNNIVGASSTDMVVAIIDHGVLGREILVEHDSDAGANNIRIYPAEADGDILFTGDDVTPSIYAIGAQVYQGTIADNFPYVKTEATAETGQQDFWLEDETVTEYRNRLGLKNLLVNEAPSEIWETPRVSTVGGTQYEYLGPMSPNGQTYYKRYNEVTAGTAQTVLDANFFANNYILRDFKGVGFDDDGSGEIYSIPFGGTAPAIWGLQSDSINGLAVFRAGIGLFPGHYEVEVWFTKS